jgi:hypothetical protein
MQDKCVIGICVVCCEDEREAIDSTGGDEGRLPRCENKCTKDEGQVSFRLTC